jgi:hypothetical protein
MSIIASRLIKFGMFGVLCLNVLNATASDTKDSVKTSVKLASPDEFKIAKNIWLSTPNSAGFALYGFEPIGDISLSTSRKSGDFKRIQDAESINDLTINAKGYDKVKNFSFYGNFYYKREWEKNKEYTNVLFPHNDFPYHLVDTTGGDWKNHEFSLRTLVASPKYFNSIYTGIGIDYTNISAAKQLDPRSLNRYYSISLKPSMIYNPNEQWHIGVNGNFDFFREYIHFKLINTSQTYIYYNLCGLGAANEMGTLANNLTVDFRGHALGGNAQVAYSAGNFKVIGTGGIQNYFQDLINDETTLKKGGEMKKMLYNGGLTLNHTSQNLINNLGITLNMIDGAGYEFTNISIKDENGFTRSKVVDKKQSYKVTRSTINVTYDLWKLRQGLIYNYMLRLFGGLNTNKESYSNSPVYITQNYSTAFYGTKVGKMLEVGKCVIEGSLQGTLFTNLSKTFEQPGVTAPKKPYQLDIYRAITVPDYDYLTSSMIKMDIDIKVSVPLSPIYIGYIRVYYEGLSKNAGDMLKSDASRSWTGISLGLQY